MVHLDKLPSDTSNSRIMRTRNSFMITDFPRQLGRRFLCPVICVTQSQKVFQDETWLWMLLVFWALILTHMAEMKFKSTPTFIPKYGVHSHWMFHHITFTPPSSGYELPESKNSDFSTWAISPLGSKWVGHMSWFVWVSPSSFLLFQCPIQLVPPFTHKSNSSGKLNH